MAVFGYSSLRTAFVSFDTAKIRH